MNLETVSLVNLRQIDLANGVAWSADLVIAGRRVLHVENAGDGGCSTYRPGRDLTPMAHPGLPSGDYRAAREIQDALEAAARKATGLDFEALDALTASTEAGETLAQGLEVFRSEFPS